MADSIVVGVRLDPSVIDSLKYIASKRSSANTTVTHNDLIREAISKTYGDSISSSDFDQFKKTFADIDFDIQDYCSEVMWEGFCTDNGRVEFSQIINEAITNFVNKYSIVRQIAMIDEIPWQSMATYDTKNEDSRTILCKVGDVFKPKYNKFVDNGNEITIPTFEIASCANVKFSDMKSKRIGILNNTLKLLALRIIFHEEVAFLSMIRTPGVDNSDKYLLDDIDLYFSKENKNNALVISDTVISSLQGRVDVPLTAEESRKSKSYNVFVVNHTLEKNEGFILNKPEDGIVMSIRQPITTLPNDEPTKLSLGWVVYEEIGMMSLDSCVKSLYAGQD